MWPWSRSWLEGTRRCHEEFGPLRLWRSSRSHDPPEPQSVAAIFKTKYFLGKVFRQNASGTFAAMTFFDRSKARQPPILATQILTWFKSKPCLLTQIRLVNIRVKYVQRTQYSLAKFTVGCLVCMVDALGYLPLKIHVCNFLPHACWILLRAIHKSLRRVQQQNGSMSKKYFFVHAARWFWINVFKETASAYWRDTHEHAHNLLMPVKNLTEETYKEMDEILQCHRWAWQQTPFLKATKSSFASRAGGTHSVCHKDWACRDRRRHLLPPRLALQLWC